MEQKAAQNAYIFQSYCEMQRGQNVRNLEKIVEVLTFISSFRDLDSIPHDKSNTPAIYTTYFTNVGIYILYSPCGAFP